MEVLRALESVRTPMFDELFSLITYFGDEVLILAVAFAVLWCFDKRTGYFIIYTMLLGVTINQFLKGFFRIPRPWVRDSSFTIVENARAAATGYSFPSGHTQNATALFGSIARSIRSKIGRIFLIAFIFLIGFSRMYLGVHTPADVLTSWAIGTALIFALYPVMERMERSTVTSLLFNAALIVSAAVLVIFAESVVPTDNETALSAAEGIKSAYTLLGVIAALPLCRYLDRKLSASKSKRFGGHRF